MSLQGNDFISFVLYPVVRLLVHVEPQSLTFQETSTLCSVMAVVTGLHLLM
jgi:hypothetical protein